MQRLAASATRFLSPARRWPPRRMARLTESPLGGTWVLDALRAQLGVSPAMRKLLKGRLDDSAERALFGLAANRALAPSSKLAAGSWIAWEHQ